MHKLAPIDAMLILYKMPPPILRNFTCATQQCIAPGPYSKYATIRYDIQYDRSVNGKMSLFYGYD